MQSSCCSRQHSSTVVKSAVADITAPARITQPSSNIRSIVAKFRSEQQLKYERNSVTRQRLRLAEAHYNLPLLLRRRSPCARLYNCRHNGTASVAAAAMASLADVTSHWLQCSLVHCCYLSPTQRVISLAYLVPTTYAKVMFTRRFLSFCLLLADIS